MYSGLQEQVKLPTVFRQTAFFPQGFFSHSFISEKKNIISRFSSVRNDRSKTEVILTETFAQRFSSKTEGAAASKISPGGGAKGVPAARISRTRIGHDAVPGVRIARESFRALAPVSAFRIDAFGTRPARIPRLAFVDIYTLDNPKIPLKFVPCAVPNFPL